MRRGCALSSVEQVSSHLLSHLTDYLLQRVRGEERVSSVEQVRMTSGRLGLIVLLWFGTVYQLTFKSA